MKVDGCGVIFLLFLIFCGYTCMNTCSSPSSNYSSGYGSSAVYNTPKSNVQKKQYIEHRKCNISELNIRIGAGAEFELNESSPLYSSENIYVLEEKDGWVRFRVTPNDVGWSGWVSKKYTCTIDEWNKKEDKVYSSDIKKVVSKCKNLGLLIKIDTDGNKAWVNSYIWNDLNYDSKKYYASIFAEYCEVMGDLSWCDIVDNKSGRKLAKHSSWGFKIY